MNIIKTQSMSMCTKYNNILSFIDYSTSILIKLSFTTDVDNVDGSKCIYHCVIIVCIVTFCKT